jgi:geranylgeranyl diphosphate synthase type II
MNALVYKTALETRIADLLAEKAINAPSEEATLLLERIRQVIMRAGKRSRPELLRLTYASYGGKNFAALMDIGVALELYHQALLVHDDIVDHDTIRYDGPNVIGYYQNDKSVDADYPSAMGLLAGNLLHIFSSDLIVNHPIISQEQKLSLLSILNDTNAKVHYGQQLDIANSIGNIDQITEKKLITTDTLKTALYSINLPMQFAAELLELSSEERNHIAQFALKLGVGYQLIDDYSDYFSNHSAFESHPKYRDFRQGKVTHPLFYGVYNADEADKKYLQKYIGNKNASAAVLKKVVNILDKTGAKQKCHSQIYECFIQIEASLHKLKISKVSKKEFLDLINSYRI